jgi:hypothetical protein
MPQDLPTGMVTFLFTDVEGSTRLLESLGTARYSEALLGHRQADAMLDPFQQPLPIELDEPVRAAVEGEDGDLLRRAVELARPLGYA